MFEQISAHISEKVKHFDQDHLNTLHLTEAIAVFGVLMIAMDLFIQLIPSMKLLFCL